MKKIVEIKKDPYSYLTLTRKIDQLIICTKNNEKIIIKLKEIQSRTQARIGVSADKSWTIHREEVYNRLNEGDQNENL